MESCKDITRSVRHRLVDIDLVFSNACGFSLCREINVVVYFAGKVTSVKFGTDAKYVAVGSMDRNLRIFGLPGDEAMEEATESLDK